MCSVRRGKREPQDEIDVCGYCDVTEMVESCERERVRDHDRARDGFHAEQTDHDHGDPTLAVVKSIYCANMYNQDQRCGVNKR